MLNLGLQVSVDAGWQSEVICLEVKGHTPSAWLPPSPPDAPTFRMLLSNPVLHCCLIRLPKLVTMFQGQLTSALESVQPVNSSRPSLNIKWFFSFNVISISFPRPFHFFSPYHFHFFPHVISKEYSYGFRKAARTS